jgi:hypothetical protein
MKKFVAAAFCTLGLVGLAMAEDFTLQITKVNDDGSVTGNKVAGGKGKGNFGGGFGKGEVVTVKIAKDVKVYKGKYDNDAKSFVKDGDELGGLKGLMTAVGNADKVNISVGGAPLAASDKLEVAMAGGTLTAKLNGKDVDINTVAWKGKAPLATRVSTDDNGSVTQVLITPGGGFGKGKKGAGN